MKKINILFLIVLCFNLVCHGQIKIPAVESDDVFKNALENFRAENYQLAQQQFLNIKNNPLAFTTDEIERAGYYVALCAIELLNADAVFLVTSYFSDFPSSSRKDQLSFETARYFYRKQEFNKAVPWFEKVKSTRVNKYDLGEYYFAFGYSYFVIDSIEQARLKFYEIKDKQESYSASALYYYSHINYSQGNYQTALEGFEKLMNDSTFSSISPYYISQILFLQGKYNDVIKFAPSFLEQVTEKRKGETARIIAESYYNLKRYQDAIPYYTMFTELSSDLTEEDYYQSGYSLYKVEEYQKAAEIFEKISNNNSALGQNASYHLADCYIKLNDKQKALIAFTNASKTGFDETVKEDALFNRAVLNYELSLSPFSQSIRDFELYIKTYPQSARMDEAYNYLTMAYLNTRNYEFAYTSLQKIKTPNNDVKKAYQHVAFFRGIELFTNEKYVQAVESFNESLKYASYDKKIRAKSMYWKGESLYRLAKYNEAAKTFEEFILSAGAFVTGEYQTAHYNLGYCYFKMSKYTESQVWFRKYIGFDGSKNPSMLADAYNRSGDVAYLKNDYQGAVKFYTGAAGVNGRDADYALMQKATVFGLQGEYQKKINTLQEILKNHSTSSYTDDALYESATSYQALNNLERAQNFLNTLISNHPGSNYEKSALLRLGLIYYNEDNYNQAITAYKKVMNSYPGSDEAKSALIGLKNIYVEQGKVENYLSYVEELGGQVKISRSQKDSLLFANAENIYFKNDCNNATPKLKEYIESFPGTPFLKRAYVYMADCYNRQGNLQDARNAYKSALSQPGLDYREQSLLELSRINYSLENYNDALKNYLELETVAQTEANKTEAVLGEMRCDFKLKKYYESIVAANEVLQMNKIEAGFKKEATYIIATSNYELGKFDDAVPYLEELALNLKTKEGAEAQYKLAEIYFKKGKLEKAESIVVDFIKQNSPHQYWVARAYLVLAEIFLKKDDLFQANHTVQSIIDYYDNKNDGIISMATELKENIKSKEEKDKAGSGGDMEIDLNKN